MRGAQLDDLDKIVEMAGLERGILAVVREAQQLLVFGVITGSCSRLRIEKAVMVVEVLRPSLPSLVSFVPSLVLVSKKTPPVGSKSSGAFMNQPHHFSGSVSEHLPDSSK